MILNYYKFVLAFLNSASKSAAKRVIRHQVLWDSPYFKCLNNIEGDPHN